MRLRDSAGVLRSLTVNCSPVMGGSGSVGGVLVSFDDVTELQARGEKLREAKNEADAANLAKSEFLANMSHEIRTPMNAILGFTDVLRRGYDKNQDESSKYLNTIHSSGTHLLDLINDILDLSKVEAGHLEVESIDFAPHRLIHEVMKVLGVKAAEKGIGLEFEAHGPVPASMASDPARLRQILTNLVGNAIKFTATGAVRIGARLDQSGPHPVLELSVTDTGIGIAEDKLDTVFEAFAQADSSVTRRFGGTGLGLPISRRFARAMGGDITVASDPGQGSTFTLRLGTGPLDGVDLISPAGRCRHGRSCRHPVGAGVAFCTCPDFGGRRWTGKPHAARSAAVGKRLANRSSGEWPGCPRRGDAKPLRHDPDGHADASHGMAIRQPASCASKDWRHQCSP